MLQNLSPNRTSTAFSNPDDFLQLLPDIRRYARCAFRRLNPEAREELTQAVVANSFAAYQRLLERGKTDVIAATPLARYAVAQTRAGRHLGGTLNIDDVTSWYCQRHRDIGLESLCQVDQATGIWEQILVEDHSSSPADIAAVRIDFENWLESLPQRQRTVAELLATGETTVAAARLFDVTSGRISQLRRQLKDAWEAFQGEGPAEMLAVA